MSEPLYYSAPGTGVVSSRNGWSSGCVQLLAVCGPTSQSHQDRAQGSFYVYFGGWLASTAKAFSHSGLRGDAIDHQCLTVDHLMQTWTQDQCRYLAQEDTPSYTLLVMDLAGAYVGQLKSYVREVFWMKPNLLMIRDIPTPLAPTSQIVWNLNVLNQPVVDSNGFTVVADGGAKLFGASDPHLFTAAQVPLEQSQTRPSYRLTLPPGQDFEFLVGLEPAPASQTARTVRPFLATGLRGMCNEKALVAVITGALPLTYTSPVTGIHTLYGLAPGGAYNGPGGPLTASPAGVLSFIGNAVGQPVTISDGGTPPIPPPTPGARNFMIHVPADPGVPATLVEVAPAGDG